MNGNLSFAGSYVLGQPEPVYYFRSLDKNVLVRLALDSDCNIGDLLARVRAVAHELKETIRRSDPSIADSHIGVDLLTASEFTAALRESAAAYPGTPLYAFRTLLREPYAAVVDTEILIKEKLPDGKVRADVYDHGTLTHADMTIKWTSGPGSVFELLGNLSGVEGRDEDTAGTYFIADEPVRQDVGPRRIFVAGLKNDTGQYLSAGWSSRAFVDYHLIVPVALHMDEQITRLE